MQIDALHPIKKSIAKAMDFFTFSVFCVQQNCKPGYVENNHLSNSAVANRLQRPT